jgi:peptide/nickel transport system permease protein
VAAGSSSVTPSAAAAARVPARRRRFRAAWTWAVPALTLVLIVLAALFAPWVARGDPFEQDITMRLRPPAWEEGGSPAHPLGTDQLGRDTFTRLVYGARISLMVGFAGVAISGVLGTVLGVTSGFFGGWADRLIMRLVDIQLAFPRILLAVTIVAMLGASVQNLVIVLGISAWMDYARIVRAQVLSLREREFVLAARCIGLSDAGIIARHVLPNTLSPVIIVASVSVANNIILESSLSFLGLGVGANAITWGTMLADARGYIEVQSWLATLPGVAIMVVVLAVNLLGDWLRDVLDPRLRGVT